jgi:hypothetical protein
VRPFNYCGRQLTCLWCGEKLRQRYEYEGGWGAPFQKAQEEIASRKDLEYFWNDTEETHREKERERNRIKRRWQRTLRRPTGRYGYDGAGFFCTGECAKNWAHAYALRGHRLVKTDTEVATLKKGQ